MRVCAKLHIPFYTLDLEKEYKNQVVKPMFNEYKSGKTPNPDISCNKIIKFPWLLKEAKKAGDNDKVQDILEKYKTFTKNTR
jgi:tRNA-specific 2-thiouridylase